MNSALKAAAAAAALATTAALAQPAAAGGLFHRDGGMKDYTSSYAPAAVAGPCYMRADVGYAFANEPDASWPVSNIDNTTTPPTYTFMGEEVSNAEFDGGWFGEAGIGCGQGSHGFRVEAVLGVRGQREFYGEPQDFTVTDPVNPPIDVTDDPMHSSLSSYTLMLNVYRDLGKWGSFVPYVGAGIGVAYNKLDEVYFTNNAYLVNRIEGNSDLSFAWSLMAGLAYQISDRAVLDLGYRYMDLGKIESGRVDSAGFVNPAVRIDDLASHEIKVGLRYHFGSSDCCAYAPMK